MNTRSSRFFIAALCISLFSFATLVYAHHTPVPTLEECLAQDKKITICHATSAEDNPYTEISISCNALYGNNGNAGHFDENGTPHAGHEEDFVLAEGETCTTAHATPTPSPSVTPEPSATPDPTTTPNPSSSPTPTNSPTPPNRDVSHSALSALDLSCGLNDFTTVMELQQPVNAPRSGITVHFTFQGQSKTAVTNSEGRAIVYFGRQSGTLTAQANGFPSQSLFVTAPSNCPENPSTPSNDPTSNTGSNGTGGGNSTSSSGSNSTSSSSSPARDGRGQVLGATTLAETGSTLDTLKAISFWGVFTAPVTLALYAFKKIID